MGTEMGVVERKGVAVGGDEHGVVALGGIGLEAVIEDDARGGLGKAAEQGTSLGCLKDGDQEPLLEGIKGKSLGAGGFAARAHFFGHAVPDVGRVGGQREGAIDHDQRGCAAGSVGVGRLLGLERDGGRHVTTGGSRWCRRYARNRIRRDWLIGGCGVWIVSGDEPTAKNAVGSGAGFSASGSCVVVCFWVEGYVYLAGTAVGGIGR